MRETEKDATTPYIQLHSSILCGDFRCAGFFNWFFISFETALFIFFPLFMQVAALCVSGLEKTVLTLTCPAGTIISVTSAFYGTPTVCPNVTAGTCNSATALTYVRNRCNGLSTCSVNASNSVFGDPVSFETMTKNAMLLIKVSLLFASAPVL